MPMMYWGAVCCAGLAIIAGAKNADGIYMPHAGYTWGAVVGLLISFGVAHW